jgi:hypothetical protein
MDRMELLMMDQKYGLDYQLNLLIILQHFHPMAIDLK